MYNLPKVSVCCFIRDTYVGAFCLFESMANLMPLADEFIVYDLGSTDGTLEELKNLASINKKIRIIEGKFFKDDMERLEQREKLFAQRANEVISMCRNNLVLYYQADEIWHQDLIEVLKRELHTLALGIKPNWPGFSFLRYQLQENFQKIKWWPHLVNRLDLKSRMNYIGDGMGTDRTFDAKLVCDYPNCDWEKMFSNAPMNMPLHQMILDVSMTGGFLNNIPTRRSLHAPLWNEDPNILYGVEGGSVNIHEWIDKQRHNPNWIKTESPFDIPQIMRYHVGKLNYELRQEIFDKIAKG
jgi:hypothetical protein